MEVVNEFPSFMQTCEVCQYLLSSDCRMQESAKASEKAPSVWGMQHGLT